MGTQTLAARKRTICAMATPISAAQHVRQIRQHSPLIRDVRRGHSRGPAPSLLGVAAMARGQRTLEHARGPQRVEDRSAGPGGRGHSDVVHASQGDLRGSDPDILHTTRRCEARRLPRSSHDPVPIVWHFFLEQACEKWWS
jgi:hypothetical protein